MATSLQWPFLGGGHSIRNLSTMAMATSLQWPFLGGGHSIWNLSSMATFFCPQGGHCERFNCVQKGYLLCQKWYTAISRKVVGKRARDNAERYCGWFWVHCSSKKFARMAREAMDICLQLLKERNNRRFGSYSCRNRLLTISHITFRDCCLHIFSVNLSQNSCIKG